MIKVAAIYTSKALLEPLQSKFDKMLPQAKLINICDDSMIYEVINNDGITPSVTKRLINYFIAAEDAGADIIFNTCSSVSEISDIAARAVKIPVLKIDEAMTENAVMNYDTIGVLATLNSTLGPTCRFLERQASKMQKKVSIIEGLAQGAFSAISAGDTDGHDMMIQAEAEKLADKVDAIVLAQGSMARMENKLKELTGKPILSSIDSGLERLKVLIDSLNNG
jgi:aspartate/glutamate racemase